MTTLSQSPFFPLFWSAPKSQPDVREEDLVDNQERREIVGDLIADGAGDSEYGLQMLMSVFPDRF